MYVVYNKLKVKINKFNVCLSKVQILHDVHSFCDLKSTLLNLTT